MTAFVRELILRLTSSGSRFQVSDSESTTRTVTPQYRTAFAEATNESVGTMTSSPGSTPIAIKARWSAAVPELHTIAWRVPHRSAKARSKRSTYAPFDEIHVERRQSSTYSASRPENVGAATGMKRGSLGIAPLIP